MIDQAPRPEGSLPAGDVCRAKVLPTLGLEAVTIPYRRPGLVADHPLDPWVDQLVLDHRPLPLAAQLAAVVGEFNWEPAIAVGTTLPALLLPDGRLGSRRWRAAAFAPLRRRVQGLPAGQSSRLLLPEVERWTPGEAACRG